MKTLKEALFSRKNLKNERTYKELIKDHSKVLLFAKSKDGIIDSIWTLNFEYKTTVIWLRFDNKMPNGMLGDKYWAYTNDNYSMKNNIIRNYLKELNVYEAYLVDDEKFKDIEIVLNSYDYTDPARVSVEDIKTAIFDKIEYAEDILILDFMK